MPSSPQTFRVFVSSTFTDLRAERRILQEQVFPDLKKYCEARGALFQAVDLRWGVNEASQREQQTMEICLSEIARCQRLSPRPNFIVLLGERYGWQPIPNKIPAAEMDELRTHLNEEEAKLIRDWYQEDTNAIPPEYVLQPRGDDYRDYDQWQAVEDSLRATLRKAVAKTNFSMEQMIKYFASATHQEIINGALQTPVTGIDPTDHIFAYLREMDPPPHGEKAGDYLDLLPDGTIDPYAKAKLDSLKEELGGKLPKDHIYKYPAQWHEGAQFHKGVLDAFAAQVCQHLISVIDQELQKITATDELTREKQLQADFVKRLTRFFTGQEEPQQQIAAYLKQGSGKPLAVIGPSGSGKSSLMAQAIEDAAGAFPGVIIYRFIGVTSSSSNPRLLLRQVCAEIAGAYHTSLQSLLQKGEDDKKLATYEGLREIFSRCLALAAVDQPLLVFLDALDQLQSERFDFLPGTLPDQVRVVVSALPELADRLSFAEVYRLPRMPEQDGKAILDTWLEAERRRLTDAQRDEVINNFRKEGLPLYLRLAFEQARKWHSYDAGAVLPADVDGILAGYFDLLEKEHTPELVSKVAGFLLSGKYRGLTEAEILDLLVFDREYWEFFVRGSHPAHRAEIAELKRLPFVVWSRLFLDLEPYLTERDADGIPIITFYHRKFLEYAGERYLGQAVAEPIPPKSPLTPLFQRGGLEEGRAGGGLARKFHATLAGYFEARSLYLDVAEQNPNIRKVVEQPYQQTLAGRWEALVDNCLADFLFLMAKAKAAMVEGILADYSLAFEKLPQEWREKLKFWEAFFRERAHILRRGQEEWPADKILLQLAVEHADESPVTQGAEQYLTAGKCDWPWLRRERRVKHAGIDPCLAVLEGHTEEIEGALLLPDGLILSWSEDQTLRLWNRDGKPLAVLEGHTDEVKGALALPDGRILSWSADDTLRLWDPSGKPLFVLRGHTSIVDGALVLPDGRILSWSLDKTLRLWDSDGKPLAVLKGHTRIVEKALALPDGQILSWAGVWADPQDRHVEADCTLRLWDRAGNPLAVLRGHTGSVRGALVLPDGRILSWSEDKTLRLWDRDGKPLAVLQGHTGGVYGALELPDGRILSWSLDETLRFWDRAGKPLAVFEGNIGRVTGAIVLSDGRILSWSGDGTLRLWDRTGKGLSVLKGHTSWVKGAMALPNGRILSWSKDRTLRVWDHSGRPMAVLEGHTAEARGALALPYGRILSWSKDKNLRLWDRDGKGLSVLKGHTSWIEGALVLPDGRTLSWSWDMTLRLWDQSCKPLAVLQGHTGSVEGALALPDGRILSWALDDTFRLWDRAGKPLAVLRGHTDKGEGALELPDGRLLSWSADKTLRFWNRAGKLLAVLEGHTGGVKGALLLPDGRLLSWSGDMTLRLWDQSGKPLAVLRGHTGYVEGALALPDGRILSWSGDGTLKLWDKNGKPLEVYGRDEGLRLYPEARSAFYGPNCVYENAYLTAKDNSAILAGNHPPAIIWHGSSECKACLLQADGRVVVTQANGQVCILQLYQGNRPISLNELEAHATAEAGSPIS